MLDVQRVEITSEDLWSAALIEKESNVPSANEPKNNDRHQQQPVPPALVPTPAVDRSTELRGLNDSRTYLGSGVRVSGKLHFESPAQVDGQVEGEIVAGDLTIGENAMVEARITAASIVVNGTITGDVVAKRRLEIRPRANVSGNVTAPIFVMHEGARFDGNSVMARGESNDREAASKEQHTGAGTDSEA